MWKRNLLMRNLRGVTVHIRELRGLNPRHATRYCDCFYIKGNMVKNPPYFVVSAPNRGDLTGHIG